MQSSAPPVIKVSFPVSSTVTAESLSKITPAAKGFPGLLQDRIYQATERYKNIYEIWFFTKHLNSPLPLAILISDVNIRNWKLQISNYGADEGSQPWLILKIKQKDWQVNTNYSLTHGNMHAHAYIGLQRDIWTLE